MLNVERSHLYQYGIRRRTPVKASCSADDMSMYIYLSGMEYNGHLGNNGAIGGAHEYFLVIVLHSLPS